MKKRAAWLQYRLKVSESLKSKEVVERMVCLVK